MEIDKTYNLPSLLWDILPKASASQIHPHVHMFVSKDFYFGMYIKIISRFPIENRKAFMDCLGGNFKWQFQTLKLIFEQYSEYKRRLFIAE